MPIPKEQAEEVKKQLISQIEKSQLENKEQIKKYIQQLNEQQLEEFLKQNKIDISAATSQKPTEPKCTFCSIKDNEMPSYKIAENKKAIAILEINPLTKGHSIIIPLEHTTIDKLSKSALSLAQKITKKIKTKLKPEDVKIETSSIQGHAIINVIPFYKNQQPEKKKAEESELQKLQLILETKKRAPRQNKEVSIKVSKQSLKGLQKISFRIP